MNFSKQLVQLKILCSYLMKQTVNMLPNWLNALFEGYPRNWNPLKITNLDTSSKNKHHESMKIYSFGQPRFVKAQTRMLPAALISLMILSILSSPSYQQNLCPKMCTCDEKSLEIICKESIGASALPHTLNPNTKFMTLNNAQTTQFSGLDYLSQLEFLNLAYNKITSIDFNELKKNKKLNILNTSHNMISELRDSLLAATLAEHGLTISNLVEQIDRPELGTLRENRIYITDLTVSHNHLTIVKDLTFVRWHRLRRLDLSYNLIKNLEPNAFFGLSKLELLNLRANRLTQIPSRSLQSTLRSLFLELDTKSSLKSLDLAENVFMSVGSEAFGRLDSLAELDLESCSIITIHEQAFRGLENLNWLSLSRNEFRELPRNAFHHLANLQGLKINSNKINHLRPKSFLYQEKLQTLEMNNASFMELVKGTFDGLESLKRLEIGYNPNLTKLERGVFESLTDLRYLSLFANSISTLPDNFNDKKYSLEILDLRNNQLICDCDLKWLTKWLRKMNETSSSTSPGPERGLPRNNMYLQYQFDDTLLLYQDREFMTKLMNLTCVGPPALEGKLIIDLKDNKLECIEPESTTNLQIGFASLFLLAFSLSSVCMLNYCRNRKILFLMLKENLIQNQLSVMMPYTNNSQIHSDESKKESHLYGPEYEHIDYGDHQAAPIYSTQTNSIIYHNGQEQSSL